MTEIVIAGGGLAGAACAAVLARAGHEVTVIEREAQPRHKICGEFLSVEAQAYLRELGLDVGTLGGAPISRIDLTKQARTISAPLPFRGIGLTRRTLDEAVLNHAAGLGAIIRRGIAIESIDTSGGIALHLKGGEIIRPKTLFLATGKHDVRGVRRDAGRPEDLVGFKTYFKLAPEAEARLSGLIELMLFRGGYGGLQLVENRQANLCLLIKRARLQASGGRWGDLLQDICGETPSLARALHGATALLEQPLTIYRVPSGFTHRPRASDPEHVYRVGDQAGVIHSFTGDGMAIALHSVAVATSAFLRGEAPCVCHRRLSRGISGQIRRASFLYSLANGSATQRLFFPAVRAIPGSLGVAAGLTRVPRQARISLAGS
jgi:flavin-dependent dehydrogenase